MTKFIIRPKLHPEYVVYLTDEEIQLFITLISSEKFMTVFSFKTTYDNVIFAEIWIDCINRVILIRNEKFNQQIDQLLK